MWNNFGKYVIFSLIILLFVSEFVKSSTKKPRKGKHKHEHKDNETTSGDLTRSLGPKHKKPTTPKPVYKWRPAEDSRQALAKQKEIPIENISDKDPEFEFLWGDDYYDDYDFEHQRNMITHGTWEAKRLNYHEAQLQEARDAIQKQKENALA